MNNENKNNGHDPLIQFHAELLHEFHIAWSSLQQYSDEVDELDRTAHFLLEHAGMLYRYTGDESLRREMLAKPETERKALAIHACRYPKVEETQDFLVSLATIEDYDDDELHELQAALKLRDSLEEINRWAHILTFDLCCRGFDIELAKALAYITTQNDALDHALHAIPEYVLPALEVFAGIRELVKISIPKEAWWLGDARVWLEEANHVLDLEVQAMVALEKNTNQRPENAGIVQEADAEESDFVLTLWNRLKPAFEMPGKAAFSSLFDMAFPTVAGNPVMSMASSSRTITLSIDNAQDLLFTVQYLDEDKLRVTLYRENGDRLPWVHEVRLEMRENDTVLDSWQFNDKGITYIERFPGGKNRRLLLMRGDSCLGAVSA